MLKNYECDHNGVIRQIDRKPFSYGFDYSNAYNRLGELGVRMAHLRLGLVAGALGATGKHIRLLDVGYGNGDFLKVASKAYTCFGSDVSKAYPVPDGVGFVEDIFADQYDIVCFWDVLEHFEDVYSAIDRLKTKYVCVSLPNCDYKSDEWFESWKHRKPDEHLWHFNKDSLVKFFDSLGYSLFSGSYVEDVIRYDPNAEHNILTAVFGKR